MVRDGLAHHDSTAAVLTGLRRPVSPLYGTAPLSAKGSAQTKSGQLVKDSSGISIISQAPLSESLVIAVEAMHLYV